MTHLSNLFDLAALDAAIEEKLVRRQTHPTDPLAIYNYTEMAVYSRAWTPVTKQCRGLIVNTETGEIVARPWAKFFNYGEHVADTLDITAPVEVTDKADGSLGILYMTSDGPAIATRGSFMSEQAQHATDLYRGRYAGKWEPRPDVTYLFEIIYRSNRIVLDYGDMDDLILLGAVNIANGWADGPGAYHTGTWTGPRAQVHTHQTLASALAAKPRPNAEGLVVRYLSGDLAGTMLKLKQADYVALHRIITGLTARRLWERSAIFAVIGSHPETTVRQLGQTLRMDPADVQGILDAGPNWDDEVRKTAPEEFTDWIDATLSALQEHAYDILMDVREAVLEWQGQDRKTIAQGIAKHPHRGMIFSALDGRSVTAQAWASIRPEAEKPYAARSEDVA